MVAFAKRIRVRLGETLALHRLRPENATTIFRVFYFVVGDKTMKQNYKDEKWIGQKFNRLTVIAFEKIKSGRTVRVNWIVRCDCGTLKSVSPYRVLSGNTKSCGCLKAEQTVDFNKRTKVKHGGRHDRLYTIWHNMKQRCYGTTYKDYPNWGGRGIHICDEWKNDYAEFKKWALENGYKEGLSLDRIDVNGNYEPENCRWADWHTQAANRTCSLNYEIGGEIKNLADIAQEYGIKYGTLYQRVHCYKWPIEKAISLPVRDNSAKNAEWSRKMR